MRRTSLAVSIPHVPCNPGLALLSIALSSLTLSPSSSANPENADQARIKQEYNRMRSGAARINTCMGQLARVDVTDFRDEAAVRAQSVRTPALRGGRPQSTRVNPCAGIRA
jgi:hypothetical protein